MAPSNEASIKSGNKPSFVVLFMINLLGTSFLKEDNLTVILNAIVITMSLMRLLENRFKPEGKIHVNYS